TARSASRTRRSWAGTRSRRSRTACPGSSTGWICCTRGWRRAGRRFCAAGELSLSRWVEVASTTPARMFGLYPRKGTIQPGSDADIVVYDPTATQVLSVDTHHMNVDYSAYEGMRITGRVDTVLSRGRVLIEGGEYHGSTGHGRFLSRELSQYLN